MASPSRSRFQVERRSGEPRPFAVVFALDISGSMTAEEIERLKSALAAFEQGSLATGRLCGYGFRHECEDVAKVYLRAR